MAKRHDLEVVKHVATPGAPTVTPQGSGGAATWTYKIVAKDAAGRVTAAGAAGSTAAGNATLTGVNFNRITWTAVPGAASYDVYRTVSGGTPASLGKIGTVTAPTVQLDDTALVGDASTAPAVADADLGVGTPHNVLDYREKTFQITGGGAAFVGTLVVEGSIDRKEWHEITPVYVDGGGLVNSEYMVEAVRVRMTAYTSGAPAVAVTGREP